MLISRQLKDGGEEYLPNPAAGSLDKLCGDSKLHQYLGLQTDYTEEGKGIITPKMIESILESALQLCEKDALSHA